MMQMNIRLRFLFTFFTILIFHIQTQAASFADPVPRPVTICVGASISIIGDQLSTPATSYLWELYYNGSWQAASGKPEEQDYLASTLSNMGNNDIVFTLRRKTVTLGVIAYDSFYLVTVQPIVFITNNSISNPEISSFCGLGDPGNITGTLPVAGNAVILYQWQQSANGIDFINIPGANSGSYAAGVQSRSVFFRRVAMTGGCGLASISNVISITVFPALMNNAINGLAISQVCADEDPALISGNLPAGGNGTYLYQWQASPDGVAFTSIPGAVGKDYNPPALAATTFYRRQATSGPCMVSLSNVVGFEVLPKLSAVVVHMGTIGRNGISFSWDAVLGSSGYLVSIDGGKTYVKPSSGDNGLSHTLSGLKSGEQLRIQVKALGQLICQEQQQLTTLPAVTLEEFDDIYVPNAFSPNQDGKNDIIYVRSERISSLRFYIYNQWGEQVFHSSDQAYGWDGTYKGKMVPVGGYVYTLKALMNNGQELSRKGIITLIR